MKTFCAIVLAGISAAAVLLLWRGSDKAAGDAARQSSSSPMATAAMVAMTEGFDLAKGPEYSPRQARNESERSALEKLNSGDESSALEATEELAAQGGEAHRWLGEIMNDEGWSDEVRNAAARELMTAGDEEQAAAAITALGEIAGGKNTELLGDILLDENWSDRLRLEAAYALGEVKSPLAADLLFQGYKSADGDFFRQEEIVGIMGGFPFPAVREEFREIFTQAQQNPDIRATAAEALGDSSGEALPYLLDLAATQEEPSVREMAAWATYYNSATGQLGPRLADMVITEDSPDVRRRLYEAQIFQDKNDSPRVLDLIKSEQNQEARIAGMMALADALGRGVADEATASFLSKQAIPELEKVATSSNNLNAQLRAVMALQKLPLTEAQQALERVTSAATSVIVSAAASSGRPSKQPAGTSAQ